MLLAKFEVSAKYTYRNCVAVILQKKAVMKTVILFLLVLSVYITVATAYPRPPIRPPIYLMQLQDGYKQQLETPNDVQRKSTVDII